MATKITKRQRSVLLKELAYLIVNKKEELVIAMNKSGIQTVSNKTPNKIVGKIAIEELNKNRLFAKNLADLVADVNIRKEIKNATGDGVDVQKTVDFTKQIYDGFLGLSATLGIGKATREEAKAELEENITQEESDKQTQDGINNGNKTASKFTTTGIVLTIIGTGALIWIGTILYKKYANK